MIEVEMTLGDLRGSGGDVHSIQLLVVVVGVEGKGLLLYNSEARLCVKNDGDSLHKCCNESELRVPSRVIPTLIAIIPSPALFPSYQSPVVGDRLVALEGQVRNLQVQVNSLCISQPATETVPDDANPQDERVLSEIQQLRSTVALLCDELKKVSATAQQQQEGDVPSPPLTAPVEDSSHGEGQKLEKADAPGVLDTPGSISVSERCGSPPYPADPQPQQHAVDGEALLEDKGVVSRPARSSVTSLPSPRASSDVKEGSRRSSTSAHLSPRGSIERRGSLAHRLSSPRVKGSRVGQPGVGSRVLHLGSSALRESGEPCMGYYCWTIPSEGIYGINSSDASLMSVP
ncbi:hypothetical protein FOZ62_025904, partial [Perkinsus olseni]